MHKFLGTYYVIPSLPKNLERLREIAYNLHWIWHADSRELFRRLDGELWDVTNHNPVMMLGNVSQERLEEVSHDDGFIAHLDRVYNKLREYLNEKTWYDRTYNYSSTFNIIYFSAEFGLTECLQTYSGGLGVLAGDHLKASSDLGVPLIGMGLLYKEGYFQQYLNSDGWQLERYEINDFDNLPMTLVRNGKNDPLMLSVSFAGRDVFFQVWKIQVGRVPLYLLDTGGAHGEGGGVLRGGTQARTSTIRLAFGRFRRRCRRGMQVGHLHVFGRDIRVDANTIFVDVRKNSLGKPVGSAGHKDAGCEQARSE